MKITLISHASVLIETGDAAVLTDPWFTGTAFNDSWELLVPAATEVIDYDRITHMWISHEHPDHFHIPTLRAMPPEFKERVVVLIQKSKSTTISKALTGLGFRHIRTLGHRSFEQLTPTTNCYLYCVGQMDSALAVRADNQTVLDINDAEFETADCRRVLSDLGRVDVVLNQFSIAGYTGQPDRERHLRALADQIVANVCSNHADLRAGVTVPIASFVRFARPDNAYVNEYANTPRRLADAMAAHGHETVVLTQGESFQIGTSIDSTTALDYYDEMFAQAMVDAALSTPAPLVERDDLQIAFRALAHDLHDRYPAFVLSRIAPITIAIADIQTNAVFDFSTQTFAWRRFDPAAADIEVNSQPLHFMLSHSYGLQTLGVSARYKLHRNESNWKRLRVLMAMNNAEVYLRPRLLASRTNLRFFRERARGLVSQLSYQLRRMDAAGAVSRNSHTTPSGVSRTSIPALSNRSRTRSDNA